MKTIEQVIENYKSETLDGRDLNRFSQFLTADQLPLIGFELKNGEEWPTPKEYTRDNILKQLELDVQFGFEKALNQRGLSSSMMFQCVSLWNWILEEGLQGFEYYAQYGLPLFKVTAVKYGFNNPIGDDAGSENKYACEY